MKPSNDLLYFDPDNISERDLKLISQHFMTFVDQLGKTIIIPDEIMDKEKMVNRSFDLAYELCKKARKGEYGIFKDSIRYD